MNKAAQKQLRKLCPPDCTYIVLVMMPQHDPEPFIYRGTVDEICEEWDEMEFRFDDSDWIYQGFFFSICYDKEKVECLKSIFEVHLHEDEDEDEDEDENVNNYEEANAE